MRAGIVPEGVSLAINLMKKRINRDGRLTTGHSTG